MFVFAAVSFVLTYAVMFQLTITKASIERLFFCWTDPGYDNDALNKFLTILFVNKHLIKTCDTRGHAI